MIPTTLNPKLQLKIKEYLAWDQNPTTHKEAEESLTNDETTLHHLYGERIEFGTAGLRAAMGAGFSKLNDLTIIQTTQGLAQYLKSKFDDIEKVGIVIGRDHRYHSEEFAKLTAGVFLSLGIRVWYFKDLVCTPMVPFAVNHYGAACGIMITASHNPKDDNGYKVYWRNGCQIIPPHDKLIAASILENLEPKIWNADLVETSKLVSDATPCIEHYYARLKTKCHFKNPVQHAKFCYTAMHGVGLPFAARAMETIGLEPFVETSSQTQPDPDFPTVSFPNPEEKGALELAIMCAELHRCSVVLANDPDADRFAVAEYSDGSWITFSGNQIGVLLASFLLQSVESLDKVAVLTTVVSSQMLHSMARDMNIRYEETLTGFKWLGNKAIELKNNGLKPIFAYEEAIGYMCWDTVFDKDGISALAIFAQWTNYLYGKKTTLRAHLHELYEKYGFWKSNNHYFICCNKALIASSFDQIRFGKNKSKSENKYGYNLQYPKTIGGFKVVSIRDLTIGYDSTTPDNEPTLPISKSSEMITFRLENECVITLRTSGTEPKVKYYVEYKSDGKSGKDVLDGIVSAIGSELLPAISKT